MTESEWLTCRGPFRMLEFLQNNGSASNRKLRLFAAVCCRRIWSQLTDERSRRVLEVAEEYLDGGLGSAAIARAMTEADEAAREKSARVHETVSANDRLRVEGEAKAAQAAWTVMEEMRIGTIQNGVYGCLNSAAIAAQQTASIAAEATKRAAQVRHAPARLSAKNERAAQARLLRDIIGPFPFRSVALNPIWTTWNNGTVVRLARSIYEERALPEGKLDLERMGVLADALEESGCDNEEIIEHCRGPGPHYRGCWVVDLLTGRE